MAIYSNITIDQGSDFSTSVVVEDATGNPADLTGYIAAGQMRKSYTSSTAYDFICIVKYPGKGTLEVSMPNTTTESIKPGRYVYDIEIREGTNGPITRVVEGQVNVTPGVTRSI